MILGAERAQALARGEDVASAPAFFCGWCGRGHEAGFDLGGVLLCDLCADDDAWVYPSQLGQTTTPCSFCHSIPVRTALVAGPGIFICSPCAERARSLRRADQRDRPRDSVRSCSFDGKSFAELQELFVVGDLSFCDECLALLDVILPAADLRARLGVQRAGEGGRCATCGAPPDGRTLLQPERGPALCEPCLRAASRVGRTCVKCGDGIDIAGPVASMPLCACCADIELQVARLCSAYP